MSLSKLSKLSPEVLACVLNNPVIPLGRRLRLRLLSNRWCDIIEDGLQKETKLVIREKRKKIYHCDSKPDDLILQLANLTDEAIQMLVRLFPALTELTVRFFKKASWDKFPSLLRQLATNCNTVKMFGDFVEESIVEGYKDKTQESMEVAYSMEEDYKEELMKSIADALAAIPLLNSLTLDVTDLTRSLVPYLVLSVLARLETFLAPFTYEDSAQFISLSLSPICTHLMLGYDAFNSFKGPFKHQLSSSLTHLHLLHCSSTNWNLFSKFQGLTNLTLHFRFVINENTALDASLLRRLVPMKRLTKVKLLSLALFHNRLALPSSKEAPLSSIKRLTLQVLIYCHHVNYKAFFQAISAWFPSLVHLTFIVEKRFHSSIEDNLGELPFPVQLLESVDMLSFDF